MTSAERIASTISIIYFSCYIFVFLVTSIFCAYEVQQQHQLISAHSKKSSKHQKQTKDQIELTLASTKNSSTEPHEEKYDPDEETDQKYNDQDIAQTNTNESCFKPFKKFTKYWLKSIWTKKKIYFSIVPHLFDQATDAGVIYTYYQIWSNPHQYQNENQS